MFTQEKLPSEVNHFRLVPSAWDGATCRFLLHLAAHHSSLPTCVYHNLGSVRYLRIPLHSEKLQGLFYVSHFLDRSVVEGALWERDYLSPLPVQLGKPELNERLAQHCAFIPEVRALCQENRTLWDRR